MNAMRRVVVGTAFWLLSIPAFAVCPSNPTDCTSSPTYHNLSTWGNVAVGGNHTVGGTLDVIGDTTLGSDTSASNHINLDGASGATRQVRWQTAGSNRWSLGAPAGEASAITTTTTGAVSAGTNVIPVTSATGITLGMEISVTGISATAYVNKISGLNISSSVNATGAGVASGATVHFYPNTGADWTLNNFNDVGGAFLNPLTVTRSTGIVNMNNGIKISNTFSPVSTTDVQHPFNLSESYSGVLAASSNVKYNQININGDTLDVGGTGGSAAGFVGTQNWGGTGYTGSRNGFVWKLIQSGTDSAGGAQVTLTAMGQLTDTMGGSPGSPLGGIYAFNGYCLADGTATSIYGALCQENDVRVNATSDAQAVAAFTAVHLTGHATPGHAYDTAYGVADQLGSVGWTGPIYSIGRFDGQWPCNQSVGCDLWGVYPETSDGAGGVNQFTPMTATNGLQVSQVAFSGSSIKVPGLNVTGSGMFQLANLAITPSPTGTAFDMPDQILSSAAVTVGGTGSAGHHCFYVGDIVNDGTYGDVFIVNSVTGCLITVPGGLTIKTKGHTASPPGATPVALSGGSGLGATVTLTHASAGQPMQLYSGGLGNVLIGTGSALSTSATTGFLQIGTTTGAPTGACGAAGKSCFVTRTDNHKVCHSEGSGTWYYADGSGCT